MYIYPLMDGKAAKDCISMNSSHCHMCQQRVITNGSVALFESIVGQLSKGKNT